MNHKIQKKTKCLIFKKLMLEIIIKNLTLNLLVTFLYQLKKNQFITYFYIGTKNSYFI
jgi:hypothetical protein